MIVRYASCKAMTAVFGNRAPLTTTTCSSAATVEHANANTAVARRGLSIERMAARLQLCATLSIPGIWETTRGLVRRRQIAALVVNDFRIVERVDVHDADGRFAGQVQIGVVGTFAGCRLHCRLRQSLD